MIHAAYCKPKRLSGSPCEGLHITLSNNPAVVTECGSFSSSHLREDSTLYQSINKKWIIKQIINFCTLNKLRQNKRKSYYHQHQETIKEAFRLVWNHKILLPCNLANHINRINRWNTLFDNSFITNNYKSETNWDPKLHSFKFWAQSNWRWRIHIKLTCQYKAAPQLHRYANPRSRKSDQVVEGWLIEQN